MAKHTILPLLLGDATTAHDVPLPSDNQAFPRLREYLDGQDYLEIEKVLQGVPGASDVKLEKKLLLDQTAPQMLAALLYLGAGVGLLLVRGRRRRQQG